MAVFRIQGSLNNDLSRFCLSAQKYRLSFPPYFLRKLYTTYMYACFHHYFTQITYIHAPIFIIKSIFMQLHACPIYTYIRFLLYNFFVCHTASVTKHAQILWLAMTVFGTNRSLSLFLASTSLPQLHFYTTTLLSYIYTTTTTHDLKYCLNFKHARHARSKASFPDNYHPL